MRWFAGWLAGSLVGWGLMDVLLFDNPNLAIAEFVLSVPVFAAWQYLKARDAH